MSTVSTLKNHAVAVRVGAVAVKHLQSGNAVAAKRSMGHVAAVVRGVPGPPGTVSAYTHTQAIALAVWTVAHNLGRWPSVTVTDHLGRRIEPDVVYLSADLVQITHGTPLTGFAYCN